MLLDILVYGLIAAYVGVVILGHVFLLRALIRRTARTPDRNVPKSSAALVASRLQGHAS